MRSDSPKAAARADDFIFPDSSSDLLKWTLEQEAIAGTLLEWIVNKENYDKQQTIHYISVIFRTALPAAIKQYSDDAN